MRHRNRLICATGVSDDGLETSITPKPPRHTQNQLAVFRVQLAYRRLISETLRNQPVVPATPVIRDVTERPPLRVGFSPQVLLAERFPHVCLVNWEKRQNWNDRQIRQNRYISQERQVRCRIRPQSDSGSILYW